MKNLSPLETAGSKLVSLPVLAEKSLRAVGLGKENLMDLSSGSKHVALLLMRLPGEEHPGRYWLVNIQYGNKNLVANSVSIADYKFALRS